MCIVRIGVLNPWTACWACPEVFVFTWGPLLDVGFQLYGQSIELISVLLDSLFWSWEAHKWVRGNIDRRLFFLCSSLPCHQRAMFSNGSKALFLDEQRMGSKTSEMVSYIGFRYSLTAYQTWTEALKQNQPEPADLLAEKKAVVESVSLCIYLVLILIILQSCACYWSSGHMSNA